MKLAGVVLAAVLLVLGVTTPVHAEKPTWAQGPKVDKPNDPPDHANGTPPRPVAPPPIGCHPLRIELCPQPVIPPAPPATPTEPDQPATPPIVLLPDTAASP